VLAVDLGLRTFAACSVYELCTDRPEHKAAFPVEELGWWAVHERSFQLALPNEAVGAEGTPWQQLAWQELQRLRCALNRYRAVYA
jgi:hypothetical protein